MMCKRGVQGVVMAAAGLVLGTGMLGCAGTPSVRQASVSIEPAELTPEIAEDLALEVGDRVSLSCAALPELGVEHAAIRADGSVWLPGVGAVTLEGLTLAEAEEELTRAARTLDVMADVSVTVERHGARLVYAFGQWEQTGPVVWSPGMRLSAVLDGADLLEDANTGQIDVIRPGRGGEPHRRVTVDLGRVMTSGQRGVNVELEPGDVVFVPRETFAPPMWRVMREETLAAGRAVWMDTTGSYDAPVFAANEVDAEAERAAVIENEATRLTVTEPVPMQTAAVDGYAEGWGEADKTVAEPMQGDAYLGGFDAEAIANVETGFDVVFWE